MKKLPLKNPSYKALLLSFKDWLDVLGFAPKSVYSFPIFIREFLHYHEQKGIKQLQYVTPKTVRDYYQYLQQRPNERRGGGLSKNYLNAHQQALKKFSEYLKKHNTKPLPLYIKPERIDRTDTIEVLTQEETKQLFEATQHSTICERVRLRDKAMLVLLYSCGLRRNEAVNMNVKDINFDRELILVRKGKNYKERYVPINRYNLRLLEDYIYEARPMYPNYKQGEALLLSNQTGDRIIGNTIAKSLERIIKATGNDTIMAKHITAHKLRHSIATHFLSAGMDMGDIKQFLGHSYLETTQIYTHLLEKL